MIEAPPLQLASAVFHLVIPRALTCKQRLVSAPNQTLLTHLSNMVYQVKDTLDLKTKLQEAGNKLVVIDFFATWCGPCKMIAPKLEELSAELSDVVFLKIDVDEMEDAAQEYDISSMPTFVFIKNSSEVERFSGANIEKVKSTVQKHKA